MRVASPHAGKRTASRQDSFIQVRQLLVVAILSLSLLGLIAAPVPSDKPSGYPAWWFSRGVIVQATPTNASPSWPTNYPASDDYAAINQGQLKNFATQAYDELQSSAPTNVWATPAGTNLATLVSNLSATSTNTDDYAAANLGQLKTVAKPFYDILTQIGYSAGYPWTGSGADDYATANTGQMKNVFSFDVGKGTATDGVPDWWETKFLGETGVASTNSLDGNGLTLAQDYDQGNDPSNYYSQNGQIITPVLTVVSGNAQTSLAGAVLANPFVVQVKDSSGTALVNAPVTFAVLTGGGQLVTDPLSPDSSTSMQVATASDGTASLYYVQPNGAGISSAISVETGGHSVTFTATTEGFMPAAAGGTSQSLVLSDTGSLALLTGSDPSSTPVGLSDVAGVAVGDAGGVTHSVAVEGNGTVWSWGSDSNGQLGDGNDDSLGGSYDESSPVQVMTAGSGSSPLTGVVAVAAGDTHTLALKSDGTVWAWGSDSNGQLGDNATLGSDSPSPVQVSGLPSHIVAIAANFDYSMALDDAGNVWVWGDDSFDQFGDGAPLVNYSSTPVEVSGVSNVTAISAGYLSVMALETDPTTHATSVWTWGDDSSGELGQGDSPVSPGPGEVSGLSNVVAIHAGLVSDYVVESDGTVWDWGDNGNDELGNLDSSPDSPVQAVGFTNTGGTVPIQTIATTGFSETVIALGTDGTVWTWGGSPSGPTPTMAALRVTTTTIDTNNNGIPDSWEEEYFSALVADAASLAPNGQTYIQDYQLGLSPLGSTPPTPLAPPAWNELKVVGGAEHTLALQSDGTVWAWGDNAYGQLGDGTIVNRTLPVQVSGLSGVTDIAAGGDHSLAVKSDGSVWAWGENQYGQLGDGTTTERNTPVEVSGLSGIIAVAAGYGHSLALKNDGTVWAWGYNQDGELGNSSNAQSSTPVQVSDLTDVSALATRGYHSLALKTDGTLWAWGSNVSGQLGNDSTVDSNVPVEVEGLSASVTAMAAGAYHSVVITSDNKVWTWGDNSFGQLGEALTTTNSTVPYQVTLPGSSSNYPTAVAAGDYDTLVLRADGTLDAFGDDDDGELGDGNDGELVSTPEVVTGISGVEAIAAGGNFTFVQTSGGTVLQAWGDNSFGQLGDNSTDEATAGQAVSGLPDHLLSAPLTAPVTGQISCGNIHALALRADGTVWAWGDNTWGELGNTNARSNNSSSAIPVEVMGLDHMVAVSSGWGPAISYGAFGSVPQENSIALKNDGTVWAWGDNVNGQLGDGTINQRSQPVQVAGLDTVVAVSASPGGNFTIALKHDGTVWTWGNNSSGQLGNGTMTSSTSPVGISSLSDVVAISAGASYALALKSDGTVWAWGDNTDGQLGDGTTTQRLTPVQVSSLTGVVATISAGQFHSVVTKTDGTAWAWGLNSFGQLGDGTTTTRTSPVQVAGLTDVVACSAAADYSVAVLSDGTTWAWGVGQINYGHTPVQVSGLSGTLAVSAGGAILALESNGTVSTLGSGSSFSTNSSPVPMPGFNVRQLNLSLAAGSAFTTTLRGDGTIWSWGADGDGQLGNNSTTDSDVPVQASGLAGIISVATSEASSHALALKNDGTVWAWGLNASGQLGVGSTNNSSVPLEVTGLTNVIGVATGGSHSLALTSDGTVWTWGSNANGQLGNGTTTDSHTAVHLTSLSGIIAIAAGSSSSYALKNDGTVWTWGLNSSGQLGNGGTTEENSPVEITSFTGIVGIAAGGTNGLALKGDGTVWAWGDNTHGEIGDGTTTQRTSPVEVSSLSGIVAISGGGADGLALKDDGTAWSWGANASGQLGDGTTTQRTPPVEVSGLTGAILIAAGGTHSVAIKNDGTTFAWGANSNGELGGGTTTPSSSPAQSEINLLHYASITLTSPASGTIATAPATISLSATASDTLGYVNQVSFYQGTTLVGTTTSSPYVVSWGNVAAGNYTLTATATDDTGVVMTSAPINIKVMHHGFDSITSGSANMVALKSNGTVWSWGANSNGQLGNGSTNDSRVPVEATNLNEVIAIASGSSHSLALRSDGTVWTWGANAGGQLGNGTTTDSDLPIQVAGVGGFVAVAGGSSHSLALKSDGTVWSWGANANGQLGNGTTTASAVPIQVPGLAGIIAVAASGSHSLALKGDGTVWAWGDNADGQLGDSTTTQRTSPVQVASLSGVIALSAGGSDSIALKNDGTVWAWGSNADGQLGDGTTTQRTSPVQVTSLSGIEALSAGASSTLAIKSDGTVWAWGDNTYGELGDGTTTQRLSPVEVAGATGAFAIACGRSQSGAIEANGTIWTWGSNANGQVGDGTTIQRTAPVEVTELNGVIATSTGLSDSYILQSNGTVWGWGANGDGQLGNNSTADSDVPVEASGLGGVIAIASSEASSHTLALKNDGTVWAWGLNASGQLGNGSTSNSEVPAPVVDLAGVVAVATGGSHSLALTINGTVWAWGSNANGQLGNGTTTDSHIPIQLSGLTGVIAIAAGSSSSYALKSDGTVWAWGLNSSGQLGNGGTTEENSPVEITSLSGIVEISAGSAFGMALKSDGTVWTWGLNTNGQLGNGTTTEENSPVEITSLSGIVAISGGGSDGLALKNDGTVWSWGSNAAGQLGDGTTTQRTSPVEVTGLTGAILITAGGSHNVAIKSNGTVFAWGSNSNGQLGNGTTTSSSSPVQTTGITPPTETSGVAPVMTFTDPGGITILY